MLLRTTGRVLLNVFKLCQFDTTGVAKPEDLDLACGASTDGIFIGACGIERALNLNRSSTFVHRRRRKENPGTLGAMLCPLSGRRCARRNYSSSEIMWDISTPEGLGLPSSRHCKSPYEDNGHDLRPALPAAIDEDFPSRSAPIMLLMVRMTPASHHFGTSASGEASDPALRVVASA